MRPQFCLTPGSQVAPHHNLFRITSQMLQHESKCRRPGVVPPGSLIGGLNLMLGKCGVSRPHCITSAECTPTTLLTPSTIWGDGNNI
jgi:hypothetical protein